MREHQFLAATGNVEYGFMRMKGVSNMLLGGTGFFVDHFTAQHGDGIVWVHGYGNVFEVTLAPGEQIDIEPGGWIYKDPIGDDGDAVSEVFDGTVRQRCQLCMESIHWPRPRGNPIDVCSYAYGRIVLQPNLDYKRESKLLRESSRATRGGC